MAESQRTPASEGESPRASRRSAPANSVAAERSVSAARSSDATIAGAGPTGRPVNPRATSIARVGDDAHGALLRQSLREAGADTRAVLGGAAPTGVALITVDPSGDNSIVVAPGANARLTPADVTAAQELLRRAAVVSTQLEIPLETVAEVARRLPPTSRLVLNPSPPAVLPAEVLRVCDPLVVNEHEARFLLAGSDDGGAARAREEAGDGEGVADSLVAEQATALLSLGPRSVVVTLGARGALVATAEGTERVDSPAVRAVDTTGAGDAFTAALAWRLARGEELVAAARFAVRVGAAAVTREGAQRSFPSLGEVEAL
ncbi:ribokinase [Streptomyces bohaiensis]|uniref:Ribokinase n=1 Tax=Streptomyces bohaiensis TaxID=1431344 RepID=A0ABX1CC79_9ACTN|nr:ribokinase [Streptomyces bohaiensis]